MPEPIAQEAGASAVHPEMRAEPVPLERRHDSMFVRLFLVMAAIMLAVHVLGVTVIEGLFPRPGSERHQQLMRKAASTSAPSSSSSSAAAAAAGDSATPGSDQPSGPAPDARRRPAAGQAPVPLQRVDTDGDGDIDDDDYGPPLRPGFHQGPPGEPPPNGIPHLRGIWPPHLGMVFQLAAILIASWVGARLLARPVQQLARGAGRLAQDVHAPPLDEQSGPAEARAATQALNRMQQRIRTQLAQQSRFLAAVSHDLRTPLTRMSLRIERIENNDVRYRLRQDLAEMNGLIDATLYYLRERDDATGPRQRVDVHALLQAVVDDAQEIGQDVVLVGSAQPMFAYPAELRRAVVNLVENAHRYGGAAQIVLSDRPERVVIDVCDNGPGIPPAELQRVLEPFYRVESSRSRATGGVGMGLAIAADIVARHGGELTLANRLEGGLRVRIDLPRA